MAGALFLATYLPARAIRSGHFTALDALLAAVLLGLAAWQYRRYGARVYGKAVEGAALQHLTHQAAGAGFRVQTNVPCPTGGDIDAVVCSGGMSVAIEIKSWGGLRLSAGHLVTLAGRPLSRDPIEQCCREARSIGARPLLWLPNARRPSRFVHNGVLIINGNSQWLVKSIRQSGV